ncbi:hypothetical protein K1719_042388 [Acacia pycnantha]|nr:hypothetical protein K1719_042388 [Acacia pycnantha]
MRLPRDMLVPIMRAYDPPTNQFRIRGNTREILGKDVAQLLGVPNSGKEVTMKVSDDDPRFQQLRKDYGKMKYDDILNVITSGESGEQFEMLFMMHMLGTFLAPTSSTTPSHQLLKVLTFTVKGFKSFDWATYVANDLRRELSDYVNALRGHKDCNSYVGGCIYMLLVLKDLHGKLMGIINDNHKRLVGVVEDELRKAQDHIGRQRKQHVGEDEDDNGKDDEGDDEGDHQGDEGDGDDHVDGEDDEGDHQGDEGDGDDHVDGEAGIEDDASVETPINIDEYDGASPIGEGGSNEGEQSISQYPGQQEDAPPRRSQREKKPKNMSPWTLTKPLKRLRKAKEQKEIFFDLISGTCTNDEKHQILIQIDDEDITREQLQTLGRRNKLSNRHLLATKPLGWKVSQWKQLLLPQHIGYNIADCDLIMGPVLVDQHWFCIAIDPSTMNYYVLDSMKSNVVMSMNEYSTKKKTAFANLQATAIKTIVSYMYSSFSYD